MPRIWKSDAGRDAVLSRYRELLAHWTGAEHLCIPTCEGETFVVACGPEDAPALVLLHGSASNSLMWMMDAAAWAKHFRVYAVDLIGEPGLSSANRPTLASGRYAPWLEDLLNKLGADRAALADISLGGWMALELATHHPDRVTALALLCPGGVGKQKIGFMFKALPLLLLGEWGRRRALRLVTGPVSRTALPTNPAFAQFMSLIYKHFVSRKERLPVFPDDALRTLSCPAIFVLGAHDAILDSADTRRRVQKAMPHAEVRWLPDAGHMLTGQTLPILKLLLARPVAEQAEMTAS